MPYEHASYLLTRDGTQHGPYTRAQLQEMLASGKARVEDHVWCEGMPRWIPLGELMRQSPPPPLPPPRVIVHKAPSRRVWPWVVGGIAAVLLVFGSLVVVLVQKIQNDPDLVSKKSLFEERAGHHTDWKKSSYEASGPADAPPAGVFDLIRYESPAGKLTAYLTPDPKDGKKHPAIVWAHGGFGGIGSYFWEDASKHNDQSARAFREAGIVMMAPSWRGENDNPGRFELFYGEVDDMLAAIKHVKTLPYVDPERVYIGGHSTGGTLTLLCAVASDAFRAAFSFGGMPDGVAVIHDQDGYGNTPFDAKVRMEARLRSPVRYVRFIQRPTFYFEGADSYYVAGAKDMMDRATKAGKPFTAFQLPGDHFNVLHPTTHVIARKILADTGATCGISFTIEELRAAHAEAFAKSLAKTLDKWGKEGGDLQKILAEMDEDDAVPRSEGDIKAMAAAVKKLSVQPQGKEVTAAMTEIAALMSQGVDPDLLASYEKMVLPANIAWVRKRLANTAPFSDEEARPFLKLLGELADMEDERCIDLVIEAAGRGIAPDSYGWGSLLGRFDEEHTQTDKVMRELSHKLPPAFIGVSLLDAANAAMLNDWKGPHPFDSTEGEARLHTWLAGAGEKDFSYAASAASALAYLSASRRAALLPIALKHPDPSVRLEAAWADLKNKGAQGLAVLTSAALEVHQSKTACMYLKELGEEKHIPAAALEPEFVAKADMSRWLQHPQELGKPPLSLEVFDSRELYWPPLEKKTRAWLFRFTYQFEKDPKPQTGYGMVGGMTWSSFTEYDTAPTPEALYVSHCALELSRKAESGGGQEKKVGDTEARDALSKGNPGMFTK